MQAERQAEEVVSSAKRSKLANSTKESSYKMVVVHLYS